MANSSKIIPIILCGGSGKRLWPLSRASFPKQFLEIGESNGKSLLQKTVQRVLNLNNVQRPILVCNEAHRFITAEQMREIGVQPLRIILEPCSKNTAPAITLAALTALEIYKDSTLLILSSDHEIKDEKKFINSVEKSIKYAESKNLVTFGIKPTHAETGYGYIKAENNLSINNMKGEKICEFTEKPDLKEAQKFIADNRYLWNSGIFLFKSETILNEIEKYSSITLDLCKKALNKKKFDLDFERIDINYFKKCPDISIDFAVMEKTKKGIVIPLDIGWTDMGTWQAVWESAEKDKNGNVIEGQVIPSYTENSYIRSDNRLIVSLGIKNLIIVDSPDALLVADKSKSQEIKAIINKLEKDGIKQGLEHQKTYRPWGYYFSYINSDKWQVKLIFVNPGQELSLQMHKFRSEHWVVVEGIAKIEIDGKEFNLEKNESVYIPIGSKHRLSNHNKKPLKIIEIQSGSYLGEDDIIRFKDKYGRGEKET